MLAIICLFFTYVLSGYRLGEAEIVRSDNINSLTKNETKNATNCSSTRRTAAEQYYSLRLICAKSSGYFLKTAKLRKAID